MDDETPSNSPVGGPVQGVTAALASSIVLGGVRRLAEAIASSPLVGIPSRLYHLTRRSFSYRWLTKEPDPDVILIDLRETRTVGPFVAALDRFIERFRPYWLSSTAKSALDRVIRVVDSLGNTRLGGRLTALLEPPPSHSDSEADQRSE